MVNIPNINTNLRQELNIPDDAVVFGRHGGKDQFNISFVQKLFNSYFFRLFNQALP